VTRSERPEWCQNAHKNGSLCPRLKLPLKIPVIYPGLNLTGLIRFRCFFSITPSADSSPCRPCAVLTAYSRKSASDLRAAGGRLPAAAGWVRSALAKIARRPGWYLRQEFLALCPTWGPGKLRANHARVTVWCEDERVHSRTTHYSRLEPTKSAPGCAPQPVRCVCPVLRCR
jgi:hypothetical protein